MLTLFLGAGFSNWTAGLPVASQLFDFNIESWGPREQRKLEIVMTLKREWDSLNLNGLAEQFIADALGSANETKEAVLWYIVRRISEPFIWREFHVQRWRRHVLMIDENRRLNIEGVIKAKEFLQSFSTTGIITTNYDLLVEYAFSTKGFNYGIPNQILYGRGPYPVSSLVNPVLLTGDIPLAKIHGSISWDENTFYTDGRRGLTGKALIIAPDPKKITPESLKPIWNLAEDILNKTDSLVFFGFAFNAYDYAVLDLLKKASSHIRSVLIIDKVDRSKEAHDLWTDATITSSLSPPEDKGNINKWLQEYTFRKI